LISQEVQNINQEINDAIENATNGEEPDLYVKLDDDKLDFDSYK
jgi:hypothetical protein